MIEEMNKPPTEADKIQDIAKRTQARAVLSTLYAMKPEYEAYNQHKTDQASQSQKRGLIMGTGALALGLGGMVLTAGGTIPIVALTLAGGGLSLLNLGAEQVKKSFFYKNYRNTVNGIQPTFNDFFEKQRDYIDRGYSEKAISKSEKFIDRIKTFRAQNNKLKL